MEFRLLKGCTSLVLLISTLSVQCSWAACFLPNGTDRNTLRGVAPGDYLPCDATAKVSMCCAIGRAKDPDRCLASGLCQSINDDVFWRESCTDRTWKSSKCIKLFAADENGSRDVNLSRCDNGSWCLGTGYDGRECCQQGQGFFIAKGKATRTNPKTAKSQPGVNTSLADASTTAPTSQSISTGAKAGIGVAVGLGVTAIVLVAVILVLRKRQKDSEARRIQEEKEMSLQQDSQYAESLARPSTAIYSTGDFHAESAELDSNSLNIANRLSYLSYRAPGLQDGPAELPSIREHPTYENPRPI